MYLYILFSVNNLLSVYPITYIYLHVFEQGKPGERGEKGDSGMPGLPVSHKPRVHRMAYIGYCIPSVLTNNRLCIMKYV